MERGGGVEWLVFLKKKITDTIIHSLTHTHTQGLVNISAAFDFDFATITQTHTKEIFKHTLTHMHSLDNTRFFF